MEARDGILSTATGLGIEVAFAASINYAMQQNDVPLVRDVTLRNETGAHLSGLEVRLWTEPAVIDPEERTIQLLPAGESICLRDIRPLLLRAQLVDRTEREVGHLHVEVTSGDAVLGFRREPIAILAYNEWDASAPLHELTAAFVLPNDPAVETILVKARGVLARSGDPDASLSGYQTGDPRKVWGVVSAIYQAAASFGIGYVVPPASFEKTGQKVRTPSQILETKLATCLDLAFLFAACCEQAGLNSLVTLLKGHAFTAVWLVPERLPAAVTGDAAFLRKRVDLHEMIAVELTGICRKEPLPFPQALEEARLALADDAKFERAVDVRAARSAGIRPIPGSRGSGQGEDSRHSFAVPATGTPRDASEPPADWRPPEGEPDLTRRPDSPPETPAKRLERWKQQLLDLTLRNRLLNFKDGKKSIPILCPDLGKVEDSLADGKEFRLLAQPAVMGSADPRDPALHRQKTGTDALVEYLRQELSQKRLHAGLPQKDLDARLVEVDRTARLSLEEGGANTLFLALGFLRWYESDDSDRPLRAPILLVPMTIVRASVKEGFRLRQADEDSRINVTLLKRLEQFGIVIRDLDPLPEDESGLDVPKILGRVRAAVKEQPRWDVVDEAALCILTFAKFLMWVDLEKNVDLLKQNSVVRHLVETPNQPFEQEPFPSEHTLDEVLHPAETWCPVDADASQLAAVHASAGGRSFVLQGPPGTGKSQTITNLVSHELALGRRVLFVSEKMAALNVVHTRLAAVGLGPFCLEAHSTKASKDSLRRQLKEAVESVGATAPADWGGEACRLEGLRAELNGYVHALHAERACGRSAFQAIATLICHRDAPEAQLELGSVDAVDRDRLARMRSAVLTLRRMAEEAGPARTHPLRAVRMRHWRLSLPDEARRTAVAARDAAKTLEAAARQPMDALGLPSSTASRDELRFGTVVLDLLMTSPSPERELLTESGWSQTKPILAEWITRGRARDATRATLLREWTEALLPADHAALCAPLVQARGAGFLKRWFLRRRAGKLLAPLRRDGKRPDLEAAERDLATAAALRQENAILADTTSGVPRLFGRHWRNGEADWALLDSLLAWADGFRRMVASAPIADPTFLASLAGRWATIAADGADLYRPGGSAHAAATALAEALRSHDARREALRSLLDIDIDIDVASAWGPDSTPGHAVAVAREADAIAAAADRIQDWCAYRGALVDAADAGLAPLARLVDDASVSPDRLEAAFERSFSRWLFGACQNVAPVLAQFHGVRHSSRIDEFRELDRRLRDLTRQAVQARLAARRLPQLQVGTDRLKTSETGKLQRFIQGGRTTIRRLFLECPNVLARYKPCVLMSPLSVAQYLGPDFPQFDVVVFDEASQMPVWEAVGAIARGSRLVVVGDSKQLPPTSFFDKKTGDEIDPDEDAVEEEESILDECVAAQVPALSLKWHYRSRHESLIAFSNRLYYESKLLTFPAAVAESPALGVTWREVPSGVYDGGNSRTNRPEAEAVVAEIVRRLMDPVESQRSLGVVTFSMAQQTLVEDLLEKARADRPEIDRFFTREEEPVFVKNLETVQGDERDVILFSICYGPDAAGRVALRFGPLNAKGGERRLNVAITRARQQVVVFSTLRPDHIDLDRTNALGVAHLKLFLDYARRGAAALAEVAGASGAGPGASCESPFEQAVFDSLIARGWVLHKQVGCSGYRVDLAAVHPDRPGRFVLGIECDGANYHSSRTARDRDRLRASVLAGLGWKLHRIWSTDWWLDPSRQIEKVEAALREAIRTTPADEAPIVPPLEPPAPRPGPVPVPLEAPAALATPYASAVLGRGAEPPVPAEPQPLPGARPYVVAACTRKVGEGPEAFYDPSSSAAVCQAIRDVVSPEGPIALELLARRVAAGWGLIRVTERLLERVTSQIPADKVTIRRAGKRVFAWPKNLEPCSLRTFRVPEGSDAPRSADEICPEEVAVAAEQILAIHMSIEQDDLLRETARQFGILRVGASVRAHLEEGIDLLVSSGKATRKGTTVTAV